MIDARPITESHASEDGGPVTTAVYTIMVVMNEDSPGETDERHRERFAEAFQDAIDDGHFTPIRYDAIEFEVVSRIPVATASHPEAGSEREEARVVLQREFDSCRLRLEQAERDWPSEGTEEPQDTLVIHVTKLSRAIRRYRIEAQGHDLGELEGKFMDLTRKLRRMLGVEDV